MPKLRFDILKPYTDIILFVVALLAANYFWKFTVLGDESGIQVTWLGLDITRPFDAMAHHITSIVYGLLSLTNEHVHFLEPNILRFDTGTSTKIVWSCTALKQSFIWIVIMLVARGSWVRKLWFIPLGLACAYLFNILRIALIAMSIEHHPEWFDFLHEYLFKYLFYGMLFCLWLWWSERVACSGDRESDSGNRIAGNG